MSFSSEVKEELAKQISTKKHCQLAEIMAMLSVDGRLERENNGVKILLHTENELLAEKYIILLNKAFQIHGQVQMKEHQNLKNLCTYQIEISDPIQVERMLQSLKIKNSQGELVHPDLLADGLLLQQSCCKRAFVRGAFLASGSISNPEKSYHFEIVCQNLKKAKVIQRIYTEFELDAKIVLRKKYYVVYLKEGAQIVDALNIMEAHIALMNLENVRILKEMRNTVNRKVNCETANINKVVNASYRQMEEIRFLQSRQMLEELPENLQEMALTRLEYPEASLKELGELLNPPVGKSGVNHRLRKISEIAERMGHVPKDDSSKSDTNGRTV